MSLSAVPPSTLQYSSSSLASSAPPCAEIHGHHRLKTGFCAPIHEFVRTERIRLRAEPGQFPASGPPLKWTDTIFPVVAGHEIPAGIPNYGNPKLPDQLQHILPQPPSSAVGCPGSKIPPYTHRPRCSTKLPKRRGSVFPTTNAGSRIMTASAMGHPVGIKMDGSALDGADGQASHKMALNE